MTFNELSSCQHTLGLARTMNSMLEYYDFLEDALVFDIDDLTFNKYGGYNVDNIVKINGTDGFYLLRKISNYECTFLYAQLYKIIFV